jgi:hypothetical protein
MTEQSFSVASLIAIAASIFSASPAASSVCYNINSISPSTAGTVCADVDVRASSGTPVITPPAPQITDSSASVVGSVGGTGVGASASASVGFGEAHLYGNAFYSASNNFVVAVGDAFASFTDELTVGASDVTATFTSTLEGTFVEGDGQSQVRMYDLSGGADLLGITSFISSGFPSETFTREVTLQAGHTYLLYDAMEANANANASDGAHGSDNEVADLSNTGLLYIDAPAGSITFLSGHDYSTNAVAGSVPEPSTWAMMILGFIGIGTMAYRRKLRPTLAGLDPTISRFEVRVEVR